MGELAEDQFQNVKQVEHCINRAQFELRKGGAPRLLRRRRRAPSHARSALTWSMLMTQDSPSPQPQRPVDRLDVGDQGGGEARARVPPGQALRRRRRRRAAHGARRAPQPSPARPQGFGRVRLGRGARGLDDDFKRKLYNEGYERAIEERVQAADRAAKNHSMDRLRCDAAAATEAAEEYRRRVALGFDASEFGTSHCDCKVCRRNVCACKNSCSRAKRAVDAEHGWCLARVGLDGGRRERLIVSGPSARCAPSESCPSCRCSARTGRTPTTGHVTRQACTAP